MSPQPSHLSAYCHGVTTIILTTEALPFGATANPAVMFVVGWHTDVPDVARPEPHHARASVFLPMMVDDSDYSAAI